MSKFKIEYEIESTDVASATEFAHQLLFTSGMDVEKVNVVPLGVDKSRTFATPAAGANPQTKVSDFLRLPPTVGPVGPAGDSGASSV